MYSQLDMQLGSCKRQPLIKSITFSIRFNSVQFLAVLSILLIYNGHVRALYIV